MGRIRQAPAPTILPCAFRECCDMEPYRTHQLLVDHTLSWHPNTWIVGGTRIGEPYPCLCNPKYGGECKWERCPCAGRKRSDQLPEKCCAHIRRRKP